MSSPTALVFAALLLIINILPGNATFSTRPLVARKKHCVPPGTSATDTTNTLNLLLNSSGPGFVLNLCPSAQYFTTAPIYFFAQNQQITTLGNPTDDTRATIVVNGSRSDDPTVGHSCAVNGQCPLCSGCRLNFIQINGARSGNPAVKGSANIEMGGSTTHQVIEWVKTFDPRAWSCMHAAEGNLDCSSMSIQNNEVGPCGLDQWDQWADGISVACPNSVVKNNTIDTPTDGGIVLFGSPGTLVEGNTIKATKHALLGGINLVDVTPFSNNYTGVIVQDNYIVGGFSTDTEEPDETKGNNSVGAMIKIGIAMGPRIWFGGNAYANVSFGAQVLNNKFTGGFGFAMAANGIKDFTIQGNTLVGNTSFFGSQGVNCSKEAAAITPGAFVEVAANVTDSNVQSDFVATGDGDGLICIQPPNGDYWPFGSANGSDPFPPSAPSTPNSSNKGSKIGLAVGIPVGVLLIASIAFLIRRHLLRRRSLQRW